jgi:DNA helicase-2/ATP-dependent DNA helicase PcrA
MHSSNPQGSLLKMSKVPSREQQNAIDYLGNEVITARPGSGKTFTIARMICLESERLLSYQGIIAISFTNEASNELAERCRQQGVRSVKSFFGTIDKFCLGEIIAPFASRLTGSACNLKIISEESTEKSTALLCKELDNPNPDLRLSAAVSLLSDGRLPVTALGKLALEILKTSRDANRYLKARYTSIYVDEYQDCGADQHGLFMHLASLDIRAVAVGDIDQAMFGFADKRSEYLIRLLNDSRFKHFDLTKNYRCHQSIIDYSLRLLGHTEQQSAMQDCRVFRVDIVGDESAIATAIETYVPRIREKYSVAHNSDIALLVRSNATLVRYKNSLNIPLKVFEDTPLSKGIGPWRRLFRDLLCVYYSRDRYSGDILYKYLGAHAKPEIIAHGFELLNRFLNLSELELGADVDLACDIARICIPENQEDIQDDIVAYKATTEDLNLLRAGFRPAQPQEINLLTYHKAKGLEFDIVFCLECYEYIMPPYKYSEATYDAYGEMLAAHYVGITRARKACYIPIGTIRHTARGETRDASASEFLTKNGLAKMRWNVRWK